MKTQSAPMTSRRAFLAGLAAAALPQVSWAEVGSPAFLAAGKLGQDYVLHGLTATGDSLFQIDLPARGHAAAPTRRRPWRSHLPAAPAPLRW